MGRIRGGTDHARVLGAARAVEAARQLRDVDVEGELGVLQLEELVRLVVVEQVRARADVLRVGTLRETKASVMRARVARAPENCAEEFLRRRSAAHLRDEAELELGARRPDPVRVLVLLVGALERAVLRARRRVGAERRVPRVAVVAVLGLAHLVGPPPVRVDDDRLLLGRAAARLAALLHRELRVLLRLERADLLRVGRREEHEEGDRGARVDHFCGLYGGAVGVVSVVSVRAGA